jgi:hypothetical protein
MEWKCDDNDLCASYSDVSILQTRFRNCYSPICEDILRYVMSLKKTLCKLFLTEVNVDYIATFLALAEQSKNSVAFSPQANYTNQATAACRRS